MTIALMLPKVTAIIDSEERQNKEASLPAAQASSSDHGVHGWIDEGCWDNFLGIGHSRRRGHKTHPSTDYWTTQQHCRCTTIDNLHGAEQSKDATDNPEIYTVCYRQPSTRTAEGLQTSRTQGPLHWCRPTRWRLGNGTRTMRVLFPLLA